VDHWDQVHIGWKSWKLIARTISPTPSLFVVQRPSTYLRPGEHGEILRRLEVGWGSSVLEHKNGNYISETRKDRATVSVDYGGPIGTHQRSFEQYHRRPPSSPRLGVRNPHPKLQSLLSLERVNFQWKHNGSITEQEAQLPQRNSASATHMEGGG